MKPFLWTACITFCSLNLLAQRKDDLLARVNCRKTDTTEYRLWMPDPWQTNLHKVFNPGKYSSHSMAITNDSLYHYIFEKQIDTLPQIDFTKKELIVSAACIYCHGSATLKDLRPRHRNACRYLYGWYIRDKSAVIFNRSIRSTFSIDR